MTCRPILCKNDVARMMRKAFLRPFLALFALLAAALGRAGTLTVLTPLDGGFLGLTNTLRFNVSGAVQSVKVTAVATSPTGVETTYSTTVQPDAANGTASGSLDLSFNTTATEGVYTIVVKAEESPSNLYAPTTLTETLDVTAPEFVAISPANGAFTRGQIRIRATLNETNLDTYTVKVGNEVVATGSDLNVSKDYDSSKLTGSQTITIAATDKAGNSTTRTITLTVDQQAPTVEIKNPTTNLKIAKGRDVAVVVDITDASSSSVDRTGIDVQAKRPDGSYIARVTLVSIRSTSGTTQRWSGIIRYKKGLLPSRFKISVNVIDKAGNSAPVQEVDVRYGN